MFRRKSRKKRKHNPFADGLLSLVIFTLAVYLHILGINAALDFAAFLGRCLWWFYPRGRNRALENLRASYPEKSEQWRRKIGRRSFEQIVMLAMDVIFTSRLAKKYNWRQFSRYISTERAKWLMQEHKGLIVVTGHYGNFEIMGYLMGMFGFDIYSIARAMDNKFINKYILEVRQRTGQKIIDKKGATELVAKAGKFGATLGFVGDQDAGRKGIFVDFFGRKASTFKSIALLAVTKNLPVCVGYSRRIGNRFFFEIGVNRIIFPQQWADKQDPVRWITEEYTKAIEQFVREDPSQYWWIHRRWKTPEPTIRK